MTAADDQRLLRPDRRTRSPSRPRSFSRPSSTPTPTRRSITASIGAVIGHEIGHGFDDEGRQFDAKGRLRDWWTAASREAKYNAHADALVEQYDSYEPIPGVHIKGKLTLGENLGDLGGLEDRLRRLPQICREARRAAGDRRPDRRPALLHRLRPGWQEQGARRRRCAQQLLTDPHSPAKYRVNGIVRNVDAWYKAFNVQPGDKLYLPPEQRVHIW